jgi:UDP-N-acetylglucosamine--N-acetylmuramyl-(pentapeptide) pyrophosphoryl-undecaprenol N-acetylglucosamine transferase
VTNNHQEKNANVLGSQGGAVVLLEPVCSGEVLYKTASDLLADPAKLESMSDAMTRLGVPEAAEKIYETLLGLMLDD